ncbi:MAG: vacuolar protein sorting-associated protein 35 [Monoraphidium minutum]|nr:MAG: vacuolar protein sorting-associated protein 35 [Monoraphidium minutum]
MMEEQDKFLKEASTSVKKNAYFMQKAMDEDNLREALRYSAAMLGELRTSYLSPQKYYELYMQVFDQLAHLEAFFSDEHTKGRTYAELYELVQHAGNVLPRLYLMVAVGCLFIRSGEGSSKELLKDLVEMTKGVQHPTRGLFLRAFLCQRSRGLLPDTGSKFEGSGGDITDAIDFLLTNFVETNKLWVRMQHQGSGRDRERREAERQQLQDLVGKNLTYLSQLDGLTFELYAGGVLPRLLEQVTSCRDELAQQYLMQAVIQGFPDAFHLSTLDALLGALPDLQPGVKLHSVMAALMDRLARYAASEPGVVGQLLDGHAFEKFVESISKVAELHGDIPAASLVEMYVALMRFTEQVHPEKLGNVNHILGAAHAALSTKGGVSGDARAEKALVALLLAPLGKCEPVAVLGLSNFPPLMGLLAPRTHKDVAIKVVQSLLSHGVRVDSLASVEQLFRFIAPLVEEGPADEEPDDEDLEDEQLLVSRLLHQLAADDPRRHYAILAAVRGHLERGGPRRMRHTFPALAFCGLEVVRRIIAADGPAPGPNAEADAAAAGDSAEGVLQWLLGVALALAEVPAPLQALRLMLVCGHVCSEEAGLELLTYEFFEQAFTLYEDAIADSRAKVTALQAIVGTLHRCYGLTPDNRDALCQAVAAYAAKLLKRADQCRAACATSHLWWQDEPAAAGEGEGESEKEKAAPRAGAQPAVRDAAKVMAGLKRALKAVGAAKQQRAARGAAGRPGGGGASGGGGGGSGGGHLGLYVDIANQYLYYFERGVSEMSPSVVSQLLELVASELAADPAAVEPGVSAYWAATKRHIAHQKALEAGGGGGGGAKYSALNV